ncbi:MAG: FAD-dependent oxidoreductase [Leptolyngbyaceae cyanobacterium bins.302]|nr:FAD-dependent oxidoreductase [Leptolyngbyaceae cyanobacterium bins.302]
MVGCGVVGAAIAYELSQFPDLSITILEKQPLPAQASSGAALGVLMGAISQKARGNNLKMRLFGIQQYNHWIPELEAITDRRIPFNQQGILRLCFAGDDLERWHSLTEIRQQQGWHLQVCDRFFLATNYPHISLERVIGAIYSPDDRQVDPVALTQAMVRAAAQQGATFQFSTVVEHLAELNDAIQIHTSNGLVQADWLVIAAGLGSTALAIDLQSSVDIRPVLGQALRVQVPDFVGLPELQPVITGEDVHLVPLGHREYWIGATVEFPDAVEQPTTVSLQPQTEMLQRVMQQAIALFPALQSATVLHQWHGLRPRPEGRPAPIVEPLPHHSRILLATGHYRNGVLLAPATARKVREMILPLP